MTLTRDPKLVPGLESLGEDFGNHGKLSGEFFFALFSAEKIFAGRTFSPTAEFFLSGKILLTHLVVV